MDRNAEPFEYYVIDGTNRHTRFLVNDYNKAWQCAKDVESWLTISTQGNGTVQHVGGTPGQVGVSYMKSQTYLSGGGDHNVRQQTIFEKYTLTNIDESNMTLSFNLQVGGNSVLGTPNGVKEAFVKVDSYPRPDGLYLVTFTFTGNLNGTDFNNILPCCCCLSSLVNSQMRAHQGQLVTLLQNHFTYYAPKQEAAPAAAATAAAAPGVDQRSPAANTFTTTSSVPQGFVSSTAAPTGYGF